MSDGCAQAQKMQKLLIDFIKQDFIASLGEDGQERWAAMSEDEQNDAVRVYAVTCQNHLRNTMSVPRCLSSRDWARRR
jgi:hypothetical protein